MALNATMAGLKLTPENFAELIAMIITKKISSRTAKDLLPKILESGEDPHELMKAEGLSQVSDEAELLLIAKGIVEQNSQAVADYKTGKEASLQFLVGQVMRETKGKANPNMASEILKKLLS